MVGHSVVVNLPVAERPIHRGLKQRQAANRVVKHGDSVAVNLGKAINMGCVFDCELGADVEKYLCKQCDIRLLEETPRLSIANIVGVAANCSCQCLIRGWIIWKADALSSVMIYVVQKGRLSRGRAVRVHRRSMRANKKGHDQCWPRREPPHSFTRLSTSIDRRRPNDGRRGRPGEEQERRSWWSPTCKI